ncbi:hypothetical protein BGX29_009064 [Mortierella sp. GBA35]|nr:hypothetical protein BGX29_009064 [Mortierella sp. GBA35]
MAKVTSVGSHGSEVTAFTYTPDAKVVLTTGDEFDIKLWRNDKYGVKEEDSVENDEEASCVYATNYHFFIATDAGMVKHYDLRRREPMGAITRMDLGVRCLASPLSGRFLAIGTEGTDIRVIDMDDVEMTWSFKGHKKAVNSLSFDPLGEFLLSSSCDGTVIVWDLTTRDSKPLEVINVTEPTTTTPVKTLPVLWHPAGEFFLVGKGKDIISYRRHTWKKSFTYRTGSTALVKSFVWSPNDKFLCASSFDGHLWVWQYKEKERPHAEYKGDANILGMSWKADANHITFGDTNGKVWEWKDVVDPSKGSPFGQSKPDPLEGLFDDAAVEDHAMQDEEMGAVEVSDNESLNDFVVDDENGDYSNTTATPQGASSRGVTFSTTPKDLFAKTTQPAKAMQPVKTLHPRFQPGSTSLIDQKCYLAFNLLGLISSVQHASGRATIAVEFHDKVTGRGFLMRDTTNYSLAYLGKNGAIFASPAVDDTPSTIYFKTHESSLAKFEWQSYLPEGEDVTAIALTTETAIVATSRGYIRMFTQTGAQIGLYSIGSIVAIAGINDLAIIIYHKGEPFEGSQNLGYLMYNVDTNQRIQRGTIPVSDDTTITWLGFSENGVPAIYDDNGVLHLLNHYRRVDQGQWVPVLDTSALHADSDIQPTYWPIGLSDETMTCIKCRRGETEPTLPKPFVTELPLKMPTLYPDTQVGEAEEEWMRRKLMTGLCRDEKVVRSFDAPNNSVAKREIEMDKLVLQMIDYACAGGHTQKALDLASMLYNSWAVDKALLIAHHYSFSQLTERMNKISEQKARGDREGFLESNNDTVMEPPVIDTTIPRDERVYKISTKEEEDALERRTFRGKDAIRPNDPFGRRVVKDTSTNRSSSSANGGGSTSGVSNPFKKKASSDSTGGAPKGFGSVVKETNKNVLPITRRATDVFEAADYLAADDQRSRMEKEKAGGRQDDLFRKRKANGAAATSSGGQKTLSMFSKQSVASSSSGSSSTAEAKRFKKQQEQEEEEEEGGNGDAMMVEDDFLEDNGYDRDEDREESFPPAAQVIPETQEELFARSVEEARGHLANARVESSLSPERGSSSVLAGFKFNRS